MNKLLEKVLKMQTKELPDFLENKLSEYAYGKYKVIKDEKYTFFELRGGNNKLMLSAHIDTVHVDMPSRIVEEEFLDGVHISSPEGIGGDDRAGVYAILKIMERLSEHIHKFPKFIVFTNYEEVGLYGSKKFVKDYMDKIEVDYIYEFDAPHDKVVFPKNMHDTKFRDSILKFFTYGGDGCHCDIDELMQGFNAAAVNVGVGYDNWHKINEHINIDMLENQILRSARSIANSLNFAIN